MGSVSQLDRSDQCCIDKTSSAELSEAINSMFRWYKDALVCFAYLCDLQTAQQPGALEGFQDCRWFTRGWTLQELIAPAVVLFFDQGWNLRGSKSELMGEIEAITGIEAWVLVASTAVSEVPLAKRMYWAAKRQTTRVEDVAYCLLGIFDVNMPMIYGEGSKAFIRLQEEILKKTTELSLFAWEAPASGDFRGILAESPSDFQTCGSIVTSDDQFCFRDEIMMTNKGVKMITYAGTDVYILDLHCYRQDLSGTDVRLGIYLKRAMDVYIRYEPHHTVHAAGLPSSDRRPIFLTSATDTDAIATVVSDDSSRRIRIMFPESTPHYRIDDIRAAPETYWHHGERYFSTYLLRSFRCFVRFCVTSRTSPTNPNYGTSNEESTQFILVCELVGSFSPRMSLYAETGLRSSPKPEGFIDPFRHVEQYGPLGDPFSLSGLSPGDHEDRSVRMIHTDQRHNYIVSAYPSSSLTPPFQVAIGVNPTDEYLRRQRRPYYTQPWRPVEDQVLTTPFHWPADGDPWQPVEDQVMTAPYHLQEARTRQFIPRAHRLVDAASRA